MILDSLLTHAILRYNHGVRKYDWDFQPATERGSAILDTENLEAVRFYLANTGEDPEASADFVTTEAGVDMTPPRIHRGSPVDTPSHPNSTPLAQSDSHATRLANAQPQEVDNCSSSASVSVTHNNNQLSRMVTFPDKALGIMKKIIKHGKIDPKQRHQLQNYLKDKPVVDQIHDVLEKVEQGVLDDDSMVQPVDALMNLLTSHGEKEDKEFRDKAENEKDVLQESRQWCRYVLGAILAYILILLFLFTVIWFLVRIFDASCDTLLPVNELPNKNSTDVDSIKQWAVQEECAALFRRPLSTVHNITFGLVTAVVTFQLGEVTAKSTSGLYAHFQPIKREREARRRKDVYNSASHFFFLSKATSACWDSFWYNAIVFSPRVFVLMWILCGLVCLIVGSILGPERSGPIYTTGQTWLGFSITTTYTYFGIDSKSDSESDTENTIKKERNGNDNGSNASTIGSNNIAGEYGGITSHQINSGIIGSNRDSDGHTNSLRNARAFIQMQPNE